MRRTIPIALILACISSSAFAQSAQESRGFEEEKRDLLTYTEVHVSSAAPVSLSEGAPPELRFLNELDGRPVARVADAVRVLDILTGSKEEAPASGGSAPLRKGAAALMFCRAPSIKGGLGMRPFPKSERYALRELVYEGIMSAEGPEEVVTGRELVGMFVEAVDYMERKGGRAP